MVAARPAGPGAACGTLAPSMTSPQRLSGILFALAAGLMWGLVFVGPLLLPEYPATLQSFGRYLAFGLIALSMTLAVRQLKVRMTRT